MRQSSIFKNLKVIDLSTVLAGPSVGSFFAELGADVIKIENPNHPDITRSWKLKSEDKDSSVSAYFSSINYKKEYDQLDLKDNQDRYELLDLIEKADVVLMNFKYGDQEKFDITDDVLHNINPSLIIGKITGYGDESDRVAYDLVLQAETGIMSMNGTRESGPVKMPIALIDVLAAHHLKEGLLIELIERATTADYEGKVVSVSLYDAAISSLVNQASNYLMTGEIPQRIGSLHPNIAPYGEIFNTADGKSITFAIGSNKHFRVLSEFIDLPELADMQEYATVQERVKNREQLAEIIAEKIVKHKAKDVLDYMYENHVPCGEIKDLEAVFKDTSAQDLVRTEEIDGVVTKRVSGVAFKTKESKVYQERR